MFSAAVCSSASKGQTGGNKNGKWYKKQWCVQEASYRSGTTQCATSVEIMSTAAQFMKTAL